MEKRMVRKYLVFVLAFSMLLTSLVVMPMSASAASVDTNTYKGRFLEQYNKMKNPASGYFSSDGVPYHTVENLLCEAPDIGHETVSETLSYYAWFEAINGKLTGDFTGFNTAWDIAEKYLIPTSKDQPTNSYYATSTNKPATYAGEYETPDKYPSQLNTGAPVGSDPIGKGLYDAYGTWDIYGMHWIIDTDNWYGYGNHADGTSKNSYINTFQRGPHESVWETVPQPSWDEMKWGGKNGYLDLFTGDSSYAKQWKYTNAPDADARQIQATYWANKWAKEAGKDVSKSVAKASKMGDYLRYSFFDKYFRKIGSPQQAGTGYDAAHYLLSWYYAWGGGLPSTTGAGNWAWRIGCSHSHSGYQNPFTAWVLSSQSDFKPKASGSAEDWKKSLDRQIEFITWLQSAEGGIGGGATNSWNGRYETIPSSVSTFYGMGYTEHPVYMDPGSNRWFGMQTWGMQRSMELLYETKDARLQTVCKKWAEWAMANVKLNADGTFAVPSTLEWSGQPDTWKGTSTGNPNYHVKVTDSGADLGVAGSLANALTYYSAATGDKEALRIAKELLDRMWNLYRDSKGIAAVEEKLGYDKYPDGDPYGYKRFFEGEVYIPSGWSGTMPNGDAIKPGIHFIDIRSKYKENPDYTRLEAAYKVKGKFEMTYHRFWAQSDIAVALGTMAILFPNETPRTTTTTSPTPTIPVTTPTPTIPGTTPTITDNPQPVNEFLVTTQFSASKLVANQMFTAKVTATNTSAQPYSGNQDVLLIVALYDANNTMQNVSYISKGIPYLGTETLSAGFKLPSNVSGYTVRAFMWDGTDMKDTMMIPLSNVTQVP